ncbi:LCP family protein [Desulforamulus hydrothermalis]|uniref:Cell envelope-related transcriptional attenuator n=1 Tax=Desulforamulus hydrothermalis Lam5 = DSM 18033 TaxID=1121428 RepID=K8DY29_9FIRM|nr:LCP family protein [Desulforamulus hydrothermalis]CCO07629.1 Cell envelope-related transcriptional attenuator [Desulforamulus hydrothermalis Lam5 = DSM 18033]SHH19544.1 transcriptional attenuator, LytR family [Desulforamulus hydrothermalis Lam5 = DSM 18033]
MERRKRRKLKILPFMLFCAFLVLVIGTGYVLANQFLFDGGDPLGLVPDEPKEEDVLKKRMNFLLMGIDARQGETRTRTDSLILVSVDKEHNRIAMISLPRDTRVEIPGHGYDKINSANVFGGPELVMQTVSDLTGVKIDHYLMTNVRGFRDIVDALGGVTIDVEKRMYHYDPYDEPDLRKIDLQPGVQRLDGAKALQYVRFRSDALGDVARTERQQKFLKALAKEMMQPSTITKLPKLVPTINKYLDTNLGLSQMITLARAAQNLSNVEIVTQTMPGKFLNLNGVSYWSVDPQQARQVAESLIRDGKVYEVVLGEENINDKTPARQAAAKETASRESADRTVKQTAGREGTARYRQEDAATGRQQPAGQADSGVQIIVNPTGGAAPGQSNNAEQQPPAAPAGEGGSGSGSWLPAAPL